MTATRPLDIIKACQQAWAQRQRSPYAGPPGNSFSARRGYRVELPTERLTATFNADSVFELTPDLVGPTRTRTRASSARQQT